MSAGAQFRCLSNSPGEFTKGRVYIAAKVTPTRVDVVADDAGDPNGWSADDFEPLFPESPISDDDLVELTIGELTEAIAEALKVVHRKRAPAFKVGDRVTISATVSGINNGMINVLVDGTKHPHRALIFPPAAFTLERTPL